MAVTRKPLAWLRNTVRNRLRATMLGHILGGQVRHTRLRIVSATRGDEGGFWRDTALGRSLDARRGDTRLVFDIAYSNRAGLPLVYNAALDRCGLGDAVMFVHDDLWLCDPDWVDKVFVALKRYDCVGVAGDTRRVRGQSAWGFGLDGNWDYPFLSGAVGHGDTPQDYTEWRYGPLPQRCELLDGVLVAADASRLRRCGVRFDTRFDFHFYDLDFCRSARACGLSLGTWLITVVHQSGGQLLAPAWEAARKDYLAKWGG